MTEGARLRIGEFSRRVGETTELLRAWETRYELVAPERTAGGLRLYTERDERRVRAMRRHIDAGVSAAEAARIAKLDEAPLPEPSLNAPAQVTAALEHATDTLDELAFQASLDYLFPAFGLLRALEVVISFLNQLGVRWVAGQTSVAQEHFASNIIGGRLRALSRGWGQGNGPLALLACPPREVHDLGLICFGLALREHGWRIAYLGANTPLADIAAAVDQLAPVTVVLAAVTPQGFLDHTSELTALAARTRVVLGGAGATIALADRLHAEPLTGPLTHEAAALKP